jgi:alpha-ketoglutarate-dependent taurine dioxygenase
MSGEAGERRGRFRGTVARPVRLDQGLVAFGDLEGPDMSGERAFPLVIRPRVRGVDLPAWTEMSRRLLEELLLRHGALLFRGFDVGGAEEFGRCARAFAPELRGYCERAAERREVTDQVFTSTEYPAQHAIPLHHEMSFSSRFPSWVWFYCAQPPARGGRTPITDDRIVFGRLDPEVTRTFIERGVCYTRNFGLGVDLDWRDTFQTENRAAVEAYCAETGAQLEWLPKDRLRVTQVLPATRVHPRTGDEVWFNHAHLFHASSLAPEVHEALLAQLAVEDLPRHVCYGDGTPISSEALDAIRSVYEAAAVRFTWELGDVLLVDNILVSHGREPFVGPRTILVAMADRRS